MAFDRHSLQHLISGCVFLLAVLLAGMIAAAQVQPEPTLAQLRSGARPLVGGGVSEFNPFNFVGPDGQLTGMDPDIIRAAAKRLGINHVEFNPMPTFTMLGPALRDGKMHVPHVHVVGMDHSDLDRAIIGSVFDHDRVFEGHWAHGQNTWSRKTITTLSPMRTSKQ